MNRREFLVGSAAAGTSTLLTFPAIGCGKISQATLAGLVMTLGNAVSALEVIEGNSALAATIKNDTAVLAGDIQNWVPGTTDQIIIEAIGIVEADLNLLPINAGDVALIDLALGTLQGILAFFPIQASAVANSKAVRASAKPIRTVHLDKVPKSKNDFKTQWNAIVTKYSPDHPSIAGAAIK